MTPWRSATVAMAYPRTTMIPRRRIESSPIRLIRIRSNKLSTTLLIDVRLGTRNG
jgi:hypothetical protein